MICRTANITARGLIAIAIAPFSREKKTRLICRSWHQIWSLITNFSMPKLWETHALCLHSAEQHRSRWFWTSSTWPRRKAWRSGQCMWRWNMVNLFSSHLTKPKSIPIGFLDAPCSKRYGPLQGSNIPTQSCDLSLLIRKLTWVYPRTCCRWVTSASALARFLLYKAWRDAKSIKKYNLNVIVRLTSWWQLNSQDMLQQHSFPTCFAAKFSPWSLLHSAPQSQNPLCWFTT